MRVIDKTGDKTKQLFLFFSQTDMKDTINSFIFAVRDTFIYNHSFLVSLFESPLNVLSENRNCKGFGSSDNFKVCI